MLKRSPSVTKITISPSKPRVTDVISDQDIEAVLKMTKDKSSSSSSSLDEMLEKVSTDSASLSEDLSELGSDASEEEVIVIEKPMKKTLSPSKKSVMNQVINSVQKSKVIQEEPEEKVFDKVIVQRPKSAKRVTKMDYQDDNKTDLADEFIVPTVQEKQDLEKSIASISQELKSNKPKLYERVKEKLGQVVDYFSHDYRNLAIFFTLLATALNIWFWVTHGLAAQHAKEAQAILQRLSAMQMQRSPVVSPYQVTPTPVGPLPVPTPVGPIPTPTPVGPIPTPTPIGPVPTPTPGPPIPIVHPWAWWLGAIASGLLGLAYIFGVLYFVDPARKDLWLNIGTTSAIISAILSLVALARYYFF